MRVRVNVAQVGAAVALACLFLMGSLAPAQNASSAAGKRDATSVTPFISADFCGAIVVHPSRILKSPLLAPLPLDQLEAMAAANPAMEEGAPINAKKALQYFSPKKLLRVIVLVDAFPGGPDPVLPGIVVQFHEEVNGEKLFSEVFKDVQAQETNGQTYWTTKAFGPNKVMGGSAPGKRMILIAPEATLKKMLAKNSTGPLLEQLRHIKLTHDLMAAFATQPFATAVERASATNKLAQQVSKTFKGEGGQKPPISTQDVKTVALAIDFSGDNLAELQIFASDETAGSKLEAMLKMLQAMAKQQYDANKKDLSAKLPQVPPPIAQMIVQLGDELVNGLSVTKEGKQITTTVKMPKTLNEVPKLLGAMFGGLAGKEPPGDEEPAKPAPKKKKAAAPLE